MEQHPFYCIADMKRKLYIDIDGVLLKSIESCPVENIHELISFAVSNFDCYWLTTHCKGDIRPAIDYLSEYLAEEDIELLKKLKPTDWRTLKTEAIDFTSDFCWIDDYVMRAEKEVLLANGKEESLILFDSSRKNEVNRVITFLSKRIYNSPIYARSFDYEKEYIIPIPCDLNVDLNKYVDVSYVECSSRHLRNLDVSNCHELRALKCYYNDLEVLALHLNHRLKFLECFGNPLKRIIISKDQEGTDWLNKVKKQYPNIEIEVIL